MDTYDLKFEIAATSPEVASEVAARMRQEAQRWLDCELVNIERNGKQVGEEAYDVVLTLIGNKKIAAIKEVRGLCIGMGLKEAKDLVDAVSAGYGPRTLLTQVEPQSARKIQTVFWEADCEVELVRSDIPLHMVASTKLELRQIHKELSGWSE